MGYNRDACAVLETPAGVTDLQSKGAVSSMIPQSDSPKKRRSGQYREKNPYWKGGRSVASNGYILIRVGLEHPLADVRGYAYEHRIVAEAKIGRPLKKGEQIHHLDGNKQNNHPDNLEIVASMAHHKVFHRKEGSNKRLPDEPNPFIPCGCGCGITFLQFDTSNRPRRFLPGHDPKPSPTRSAILLALANGHLSRQKIAEVTGLHLKCIATALTRLKQSGKVTQVSHGVWKRTQ